MNLTVIKNETPGICGLCGGKCCKSMPGTTMPEDFTSEASLRYALKSELWCIDWWEGDLGGQDYNQIYYVRPAIKGQEGKLKDPSWGGECTFLTPTGCSKDFDHRPFACRKLDASTCSRSSVPRQIKEACVLAWRKHQPLLLKLMEELA